MGRSREVDKEGIGSDACQRCLSSRELELESHRLYQPQGRTA